MFSKRIKPMIVEARETRSGGGPDDKGDLTVALVLEVPVTIPLARDLGPGVVALIKSRDANDPKVLPFKKATLPEKYEGLRLSVFDSTGVKFEAEDCTVTGTYLARDKDKPANAIFGGQLKVPAPSQQHMNYLINAVGCELEIALVQAQQELEL